MNNNYKDLGFDENLLRILTKRPLDISANDFDSFVEIPEGAVKESNLEDEAVTNDKLAALAVAAANMADASVTTEKLADLAVEAEKLALNAVTTEKIANAAVGSAAIANLAVGTAAIADGAILNAKIADGTILSVKIGDAQITNAKIADATIQSAKIASIDANKINVGTLTGFTIQTATTGYRVKMTSSQWIQFLYGDTEKGSIGADTGDSMIYNSIDNHLFFQGAILLATFNEHGITLPSSKSIFFTGGTEIRDEGSNLYIDRKLEIGGHIYPRLDNTYDLGSGDKRWREGFFEDIEVDDLDIKDGIIIKGTSVDESDDGTYGFLTAVRVDSGELQYKYRTFTIKCGIMTGVGGESNWQNGGSVN
jgi:hypothetical protein